MRLHPHDEQIRKDGFSKFFAVPLARKASAEMRKVGGRILGPPRLLSSQLPQLLRPAPCPCRS